MPAATTNLIEKLCWVRRMVLKRKRNYLKTVLKSVSVSTWFPKDPGADAKQHLPWDVTGHAFNTALRRQWAIFRPRIIITSNWQCQSWGADMAGANGKPCGKSPNLRIYIIKTISLRFKKNQLATPDKLSKHHAWSNTNQLANSPWYGTFFDSGLPSTCAWSC